MSRRPMLIDDMIHRRLLLAFCLAQAAAGLVYNVEFCRMVFYLGINKLVGGLNKLVGGHIFIKIWFLPSLALTSTCKSCDSSKNKKTTKLSDEPKMLFLYKRLSYLPHI